MNATDLFKEGKLAEARKVLVDKVKSSPADTGSRTLLFQVLIFCGEWEKGLRHLDLIAAQDPAKEPGIQVYRDLINAENERIEVINLKQTPSLMPETPPYFETYYAGLEKLAEKKTDEAQEFFKKAGESRPQVSGTVNGKPFEGLSDTDTFLSAFLEAFVHERYVWIPFEYIREIVIEPPKNLFDLIWISASITTWEGLSMNCFLPVLYPDSFNHDDEKIKLGRMTDWESIGGPFYKGLGQHVYQIGDEDMAILEIQEAVFKFYDSEESDSKGSENGND